MVDVMGTDGKFHTIAMAKNCSMDLGTSFSDAQTKDDNERFNKKEVTGKNWSLSTENLVPVEKKAMAYDTLLGLMLARKIVELRFVLYSGASGKETGDVHDWLNAGGVPEEMMSGNALITKLSENGSNKEDATMSATFTGKGRPAVALLNDGDDGPTGE